jgi:hypothetical protein
MADFGLIDELREALAQVSVESLRDLPSDRDSLVVLCNLAQACVVAGSPEQCSTLYEAATEQNQKMGFRPAEVHARFALGCLLLDSTRVNDVARGREVLAQTRDAAAQIGFTTIASAAAQRLERP